MRITAPIAALALACAPGFASSQDSIPAGTDIRDALCADLHENGLTHLLGIADEFVPEELVIGSIPQQEIFDLFFCTQDFWAENLKIYPTIDNLFIDGTPSSLDLVANLSLQINSEADPATIVLDGCLDYVCLLHSDPAPIQARLPITLAISADENGDPFVDVTFGGLDQNITDALGSALHLTGCAIGDINEFLSNIGLNLIDLVLGQLEGEITSQIDALLYGDPDDPDDAGLEGTLEDALTALWFNDSFDVLDTSLEVDLAPTAIEHNDEGLRLVMGGSLAAEPAPCVAGLEDPGSPFTDTGLPVMTATHPLTGEGYHVGALVSDDFVNQAMYAAWRGGVLCFALDELGSSPLDTSLLTLLIGVENEEVLDELVDGQVPMLVRTAPSAQPIALFDGDHDLDVSVPGLEVEFYLWISERWTRLASVAVDVAAGVDISIRDDGALTVDVFLDTDNLNPRVAYNELAPALDEALENNFPNFLGVVIDTVAGSFLEGIATALPTVFGQGLVALELDGIASSGGLVDWLGAYATLGETTGGEGAEGCDSCGDSGGGCDTAGCGGDSGCGELGADGCDVESILQEQGCSGTGSSTPDDLGCQGCKVAGGQVAPGHFTFVLDPHGAHHRRSKRGPKVGALPVLAVMLPLLAIARRRR